MDSCFRSPDSYRANHCSLVSIKATRPYACEVVCESVLKEGGVAAQLGGGNIFPKFLQALFRPIALLIHVRSSGTPNSSMRDVRHDSSISGDFIARFASAARICSISLSPRRDGW